MSGDGTVVGLLSFRLSENAFHATLDRTSMGNRKLKPKMDEEIRYEHLGAINPFHDSKNEYAIK
jgi:hypothetical protein